MLPLPLLVAPGVSIILFSIILKGKKFTLTKKEIEEIIIS